MSTEKKITAALAAREVNKPTSVRIISLFSGLDEKEVRNALGRMVRAGTVVKTVDVARRRARFSLAV